MGNRNANQNEDNNNRDNEQILIQNDAHNPLAKIDPPSVKNIRSKKSFFNKKNIINPRKRRRSYKFILLKIRV